MKWILVVVGALGAVVALMALIGAWLPKAHVATRSARFRQTPEALWSVLTDPTGMPAWRSDLESVEVLASNEGRAAWRETGQHGQITLEVVQFHPPEQLVTRIADAGLPFGGSWTYELRPAEGGSVLTITENGEVYNPIFRLLSRFVFGHTATLEKYLKALGKKFGEDVTPVPG